MDVSILINKLYKSCEKISINNNIFEAIAADVKLAHDDNINIIGIYKPPNSKISEFNNDFESLFVNLNLKTNKCVVGDNFNICLFKKDVYLDVECFTNLVSSFFNTSYK